MPPSAPSEPSWTTVTAEVALVLVWLAMLTVGTGGADDNILRALYVGSHPALVEIARLFTFLGTTWVGIPVTVSAAAVLLWLGRRRAAVAALLVIAVGRLLVEAQKYAIDRLRPTSEIHLAAAVSPAFPSGHAANSMIVCLTLALAFFSDSRWKKPAAVVALLLSFAIGTSRTMLGVHWPTDVIGGWAFGLLWVLVALPLAERIARR